MNQIEVTINKPLYDNFCYIRAKYVEEAIRKGYDLKINIPQGSATVSPLWWKSTGKKLEQVFKIPNRPMLLWGNFVNYKK